MIKIKNNFFIIHSLLKVVPKKQILPFIINTITKTLLLVMLPFFMEKIVKLATNGDYITALIHTVAYFILMISIEILYIQNSKRNFTLYNELRRNFTLNIQTTLMSIDYHKFESSQELQKAYDAFEATNSNDTGIEGIYHSLFDIGWRICSVIVLAVYFSFSNIFITLIFLLSSLFNFILETKKQNIYLNNIGEIYSKKRKLVYFTYDISDVSYGKEKRIYKFFNNIRNNYQSILNSYSSLLNEINGKEIVFDVLKSIIDIVKFSAVFYLLYLTYFGQSNLERIIASITVVFSFSYLLDELISKIAFILKETAKAEKVFEFIEKKDMGLSVGIDIGAIKKIEFKNVYFKYPGNSDFTISDCSFTIYKGDSVAIIGLNGSGKTTLTKLMLGLYKPTDGNIYINDYDISKVDQNKFFESIAYVEQEHNLVSIKLCDFIAGSNNQNDYDMELIRSALMEVGLLKKIEDLPNGINSTLTKYLEEDGVEFSGGEIQKLYLARAIYRDKADLYIFDEPTSSLDYISEKNVYESFNRISKDSISLFITHKLNTTDFCNRIMIMDKGRIIDEGTKDSLYANSVFYKKMLNASGEGGED